ncbi:MAG: HD domain-containing protein [Bryobacteraceae bacterium]
MAALSCKDNSMCPAARLYAGAVIAAGVALLGQAALTWESRDPIRFVVFLVVTCAASCMKVVLPSVSGTMSGLVLFALVALPQLGPSETTLLACTGIVVQTLWHARTKPRPVQVAFNIATMAISTATAYDVFRTAVERGRLEVALALLLAATAFYAANTVAVSLIIAITESRPVWPVWRDGYRWSFPVYLVGAALAAIVNGLSVWIGWQTSLLILPVLYVIHSFHKLNIDRLEKARAMAEQESVHEREKTSIHLRTIEALALAIEAKDGTTHDHLQRVQVYAIEVGKDLGLSDDELEALRAAAILHDIGKIAVPEYIISKPGRLTQAEFTRMKIHPVVGARILDQVQFPYPVSPIVRSHHEKWDGTGYPDGLKGEQIPIGARILSAVDCFDALASHRQYRRAMPLPDALAVLHKESGKAFDPAVVEVLARRYLELEELARGSRGATEQEVAPVAPIQVERGAAPATGFAEAGPTGDLANLCARLAEDRGVRALADFGERATRQIRPDAFAVFLERDQQMVCVFAQGVAVERLEGLSVPVGSGMLGWVAENRKPIVNGNPSVDPGFSFSPGDPDALLSALAVPVEPDGWNFGILCLYSKQADAFTRANLRTLQELALELADYLDGAATAPDSVSVGANGTHS